MIKVIKMTSQLCGQFTVMGRTDVPLKTGREGAEVMCRGRPFTSVERRMQWTIIDHEADRRC